MSKDQCWEIGLGMELNWNKILALVNRFCRGQTYNDKEAAQGKLGRSLRQDRLNISLAPAREWANIYILSTNWSGPFQIMSKNSCKQDSQKISWKKCFLISCSTMELTSKESFLWNNHSIDFHYCISKILILTTFLIAFDLCFDEKESCIISWCRAKKIV